jgi:hypothetical protein
VLKLVTLIGFVIGADDDRGVASETCLNVLDYRFAFADLGWRPYQSICLIRIDEVTKLPFDVRDVDTRELGHCVAGLCCCFEEVNEFIFLRFCFFK